MSRFTIVQPQDLSSGQKIHFFDHVRDIVEKYLVVFYLKYLDNLILIN